MNVLRLIAIGRSRHYARLFEIDDRGRPLSRDAEIVLADLRDFCGAYRSPFNPDPYVAARNAGRLDVWLRIVNHLHLDEGQVRKLMEMDDGL